MLTISRKENKIVSGVSPRLPFAWPRVDRPSRLLSFARPPGSSAWLARRPARPLGSWFVALLRTFQMINILSLLISPWHLTLFWVMGHVLLPYILLILPILPCPLLSKQYCCKILL